MERLASFASSKLGMPKTGGSGYDTSMSGTDSMPSMPSMPSMRGGGEIEASEAIKAHFFGKDGEVDEAEVKHLL